MSTIEKTYSKGHSLIKILFGAGAVMVGFFAMFIFSPSHFFGAISGTDQELINTAHADSYTAGPLDPGGVGVGSGGEGGCGSAGSGCSI